LTESTTTRIAVRLDGSRDYSAPGSLLRARFPDRNLIVSSGEMFEYYSPLDGSGAGSNSFSWTAALLLDLLAREDLPEIQAEAARMASGHPGVAEVPDARRAGDDAVAGRSAGSGIRGGDGHAAGGAG